jgi:hypothetical protein
MTANFDLTAKLGGAPLDAKHHCRRQCVPVRRPLAVVAAFFLLKTARAR